MDPRVRHDVRLELAPSACSVLSKVFITVAQAPMMIVASAFASSLAMARPSPAVSAMKAPFQMKSTFSARRAMALWARICRWRWEAAGVRRAFPFRARRRELELGATRLAMQLDHLLFQVRLSLEVFVSGQVTRRLCCTSAWRAKGHVIMKKGQPVV